MGELIVIGSGTGIPSLKRGAPGFIVLSDSARLLIDSGSGTLGRMLEVGVTFRDPDVLLYTHIHPDHVSDLVPIIFASKYADQPREKGLLCIGGPGFQSYFEKLKNLYGSWVDPQSYPLTLREISEEALVYRDVRISSKPMAHIAESVGYRIEFKDGKSMAISGDTDYCQNIIDLAFEVDLLVIECSFPDTKKVEGHLTPSLAGKIGVESRCKKLLLTHLYPVCDQFDILMQCRQVYSGPIILGEDFMRISI
ncbi:MAG TPA: MBL fold metallo-hydrolase [Thermodesulfobacteriota bacterium]|nr:MBL fold metallo-hydrolase [Thermodesulfobacteriota bacterium]